MNTQNNIGFAPRKGLSKSLIIWICVGVTLLFLLFGTCTTYNSVQKSSIAVDEAWGNVQSQYQRRFDLIPNLVNTVKGAARHEEAVQVGTAEVRANRGAQPLDPRVEAAGKELLQAAESAQAFSGPDANTTPDPSKYANFDRAYGIYVNAVHEAYPGITATESYNNLMAELAGTENRINTARDRYNASVKEFNTGIVTFPRNIVAGIFGFQRKQMFQADAAAAKAPVVEGL